MQSRSRAGNSNRGSAFAAAGVCLALVVGCSSTGSSGDDGGGGHAATGGTQGAAGASAGKGGSPSGSGGSSGTSASGGSGGTVSASGGAGAGGHPGGAGTGGSSGTSFSMGGRAGSATGGGPTGGAAGSSALTGGATGMSGNAGSMSEGGRLGMGGRGMGGRSMAGSSGSAGAAMAGGAGSGGTGGSGGDFAPCPTTGDPCKILPLGDSITYGIQYEGAWRVELFHDTLKDNKKITFVGSQMNGPSTVDGTMFPKSHEGHSGYTIDQMKPFVMTTDVPYMPNMILLHIGTNDTYGTSPSGAPMRLADLADLILSTYPNTLLVVAKIIPYPSQAANVKLINDSIPDMVNQRAMAGKHIAMADCNTGFMTSSMLSSDSIHPNQTGYNFMGDQFYSVISKYLH
jgi:lysophospholipase L1-like esterase